MQVSIQPIGRLTRSSRSAWPKEPVRCRGVARQPKFHQNSFDNLACSRLPAAARNDRRAEAVLDSRPAASNSSLRDELIVALRDIDERRRVLRVSSLVEVYAVLLRAQPSQLAELADYCQKAQVHNVCLEAVAHGDLRQRTAALGTLGILLLETSPENVAILITVIRQSDEANESALLRAARELLRSQHAQVQWAAMKLVHGLCCFPVVADAVCNAPELQTAVASAGLKPLLRVDAPDVPRVASTPASWGPQFGSELDASPGSRPFPTDCRSEVDINADMLHIMLTVMGALLTASVKEDADQAIKLHVHSTLIAILWEEQLSTLKHFPHVLHALGGQVVGAPPQPDSSVHESPASIAGRQLPRVDGLPRAQDDSDAAASASEGPSPAQQQPGARPQQPQSEIARPSGEGQEAGGSGAGERAEADDLVLRGTEQDGGPVGPGILPMVRRALSALRTLAASLMLWVSVNEYERISRQLFVKDCERAADLWFSRETMEAAGLVYVDSDDDESEDDEKEADGAKGGAAGGAQTTSPPSLSALSTAVRNPAGPADQGPGLDISQMDPSVVESAVTAVFGDRAKVSIVVNENAVTSIRIDLEKTGVQPTEEKVRKLQDLLAKSYGESVVESDPGLLADVRASVLDDNSEPAVPGVKLPTPQLANVGDGDRLLGQRPSVKTLSVGSSTHDKLSALAQLFLTQPADRGITLSSLWIKHVVRDRNNRDSLLADYVVRWAGDVRRQRSKMTRSLAKADELLGAQLCELSPRLRDQIVAGSCAAVDALLLSSWCPEHTAALDDIAPGYRRRLVTQHLQQHLVRGFGDGIKEALGSAVARVQAKLQEVIGTTPDDAPDDAPDERGRTQATPPARVDGEGREAVASPTAAPPERPTVWKDVEDPSLLLTKWLCIAPLLPPLSHALALPPRVAEAPLFLLHTLLWRTRIWSNVMTMDSIGEELVRAQMLPLLLQLHRRHSEAALVVADCTLDASEVHSHFELLNSIGTVWQAMQKSEEEMEAMLTAMRASESFKHNMHKAFLLDPAHALVDWLHLRPQQNGVQMIAHSAVLQSQLTWAGAVAAGEDEDMFTGHSVCEVRNTVANTSGFAGALYAALAAALLTSPREVLPLLKAQPYMLEQAARELRSAAVGAREMRAFKYPGAPTPFWHHPLLFTVALARQSAVLGGLSTELAMSHGLVEATALFASACIRRIEQARSAPEPAFLLDQEQEETAGTWAGFSAMPEAAVEMCGPVPLGDALAYLGLAQQALAAWGARDAAIRETLARHQQPVQLHIRTLMTVSQLENGRSKARTRTFRYLYCHPVSRFFMRHAGGPCDVLSTPQDEAAAKRAVSLQNVAAPLHADALPPSAVLRATLALLEVYVRDGSPEDCQVLLETPGVMSKLKSQVTKGDGRAHQAISLLSALITASPAAAAAAERENVPQAVMRVFKDVSDALRSPPSARKGAPPVNRPAVQTVAALCVQFFLRMAAAPPVNAESTRLVVGESQPSKHVPMLACLPHLVACTLPLMQLGSDAGRQLAAELLRLLASERVARNAIRNEGGNVILLDALNSGPPQVQTSALATLRTLWSAEEGDSAFQRQLYLMRGRARDSSVEILTDLMRQSLTWPPARPPAPSQDGEPVFSGLRRVEDLAATASLHRTTCRQLLEYEEGALVGVVVLTLDGGLKIVALEDLYGPPPPPGGPPTRSREGLDALEEAAAKEPPAVAAHIRSSLAYVQDWWRNGGERSRPVKVPDSGWDDFYQESILSIFPDFGVLEEGDALLGRVVLAAPSKNQERSVTWGLSDGGDSGSLQLKAVAFSAITHDEWQDLRDRTLFSTIDEAKGLPSGRDVSDFLLEFSQTAACHLFTWDDEATEATTAAGAAAGSAGAAAGSAGAPPEAIVLEGREAASTDAAEAAARGQGVPSTSELATPVGMSQSAEALRCILLMMGHAAAVAVAQWAERSALSAGAPAGQPPPGVDSGADDVAAAAAAASGASPESTETAAATTMAAAVTSVRDVVDRLPESAQASLFGGPPPPLTPEENALAALLGNARAAQPPPPSTQPASEGIDAAADAVQRPAGFDELSDLSEPSAAAQAEGAGVRPAGRWASEQASVEEQDGASSMQGEDVVDMSDEMGLSPSTTLVLQRLVGAEDLGQGAPALPPGAPEAFAAVPKLAKLLETGGEATRVQVCTALGELFSTDSSWTFLALQSNVHILAMRMLQSGTPSEQAAATLVLRTLGLSAKTINDILRDAGVHQALAKLLHLQGPRLAEVRYEAANTLIALISSLEDQDAVASVCLSAVCAVIIETDLEAEVTSMMTLAVIMCVGSHQNQIHAVVMGVLPRLLQLMQHPHAYVREQAVRLMAVLANAEENRQHFERLELLPHVLAGLMAAGVDVNGACDSALQDVAAHAANCVYNRVRIDDSDTHHEDEMRTMCEVSALVYAVQLLESSSERCREAAMDCVEASLLCPVKEVHLHVLGLGVVPLLWRISGQATPDEASTNFAARARQVLTYVDGDWDAVSHVAAAGVVPLRLHLLVDNIETLVSTDDGGDGGGSGRRLPRLDDDDGPGKTAKL